MYEVFICYSLFFSLFVFVVESSWEMQNLKDSLVFMFGGHKLNIHYFSVLNYFIKPNPCLKTKEKYVSFKFLLKLLETKFQPS